MGVTGYLQGLLINTIPRSHAVPRHLRIPLLRALGISIGSGTIVGAECRFIGRKVQLASRVYIGTAAYFDAHAEWVRIGDNTALGPEVMLLTSTHAIGPSHYRVVGGERYAPVTIGRGCWIGARTTILPGVTVGDGCVIAAGSLVIRDCAPDGLYAGIPANRKRDLFTEPD